MKSVAARILVALLAATAGCYVGYDDEIAEQPSTVFAEGDLAPSAQTLLGQLHALPDGYILSGQESMLWDGPWNEWFPSSRDAYVRQRVGEYPALFASDFGDFDQDTESHRAKVVDMALEYAANGSVIMLSYHLCQPDAPSGCGFETMHGFSKDDPYPRWRIDQILEEGTALHETHMQRLDEVAGYLAILRDAGVPVIWRPFHEMNGDWFWWCQQPRYAELYRQMHDRFVNVHGLDNLIWTFSVNYWHPDWGSGEQLPSAYYPGHDVVDVIGVDIYTEYGHAYEKRVHDELHALGGGNKVIAITENGELPDWPSLAEEQPHWAFWSTWWGFEAHTDDAQYQRVFDDHRVLTLGELEDVVDMPDPVELPPEPSGDADDCPCLEGTTPSGTTISNFCHYPLDTAGCAMLRPGGFCDPNGDGKFSDAEWTRG